MMLFSDDTSFPNLFLGVLLCPPRLVEVDRILDNPVPPETLMVAFADIPAAMPPIIIDALPPAAAFTDAWAMEAAIVGTKFSNWRKLHGVSCFIEGKKGIYTIAYWAGDMASHISEWMKLDRFG